MWPTTILQPLYRSTCISWNTPPVKNWRILLEQKFYCLHALANGNQCIRIREKTLEFSSTVLSIQSLYLMSPYLITWVGDSFYYRAMLCIRGTSHGPVSVCPSVSVTSRSSTKTAKRRITQTTPQRRNSSFLTPKITAKFDRYHPLRGRQMQVGWVKIGDFGLITSYVSKTVQDRHIVSIKVE